MILFAANRGIVAASNAGIAATSPTMSAFSTRTTCWRARAAAVRAGDREESTRSTCSRRGPHRRTRRGSGRSSIRVESRAARTTNCVRTVCWSSGLLQALVGFREGMDGVQTGTWHIRIAEAVPADRIHHLPEVLYHWRCTKARLPPAPTKRIGCWKSSGRSSSTAPRAPARVGGRRFRCLAAGASASRQVVRVPARRWLWSRAGVHRASRRASLKSTLHRP